MVDIIQSNSCLICGSSKVKEIVTFKSGTKVFLCKRCKNAFTYPKPYLPDYASLDFHARDNTDDNDELTYVSSQPEEIQDSYRVQLELIKSRLIKGSEILEIGGGEGIFLETLKNDYNVELVEPSKSASKRAKARGIKVYNDYFQNLSFEKRYDLLCMSHVLEHIDEPIETIKSFKKVIRSKGFILLTQTNYKGFMPSLLKEDWYAWAPDQHFWHFSIEGIKYLANELELKVVTYKYSRLFHGASIYHKMAKYFPLLQDQIHVLLQLK